MKAVRAVYLLIFVLFFSLLPSTGFSSDVSASTVARKGHVAPDFEVVDLNGNAGFYVFRFICNYLLYISLYL